MYYPIKLTHVGIMAAKNIYPPNTECYSDTDPMLRVRFGKTRISLAVRVNARNDRSSKVLGHYPDLDLASFKRLAKKRVMAIKEQGVRGVHRVTVDQFFMEVVLPASRHNKTVAKCKRIYEKRIATVIGQYALGEVTSMHIQGVFTRLPSVLANASVNRIRSVVMRLFSLAVKYGLIHSNPCLAIARLPENNVVERVMNAEETAAFVREALNHKGSLHALSLVLSLFTGVRIGNVISLEKSMITSEQSYIILMKTKSGKHQLVPLSSQAKWILEQAALLSTGEYVFSSGAARGHISPPNGVFKRICKSAGIVTTGCGYSPLDGFIAAPLTIHCLRKTFATAVLKHTGSMDYCSELLGHSDTSVTKRYAFFHNVELSEASDGAGELLMKGLPNLPSLT